MTTGFAKDILPLFRHGDVRCMTAKGIHLGDAAWMCDAASHHGFGDHGNARRDISMARRRNFSWSGFGVLT